VNSGVSFYAATLNFQIILLFNEQIFDKQNINLASFDRKFVQQGLDKIISFWLSLSPVQSQKKKKYGTLS
jgi:hypothetical protein